MTTRCPQRNGSRAGIRRSSSGRGGFSLESLESSSRIRPASSGVQKSSRSGKGVRIHRRSPAVKRGRGSPATGQGCGRPDAHARPAQGRPLDQKLGTAWAATWDHSPPLGTEISTRDCLKRRWHRGRGERRRAAARRKLLELAKRDPRVRDPAVVERLAREPRTSCSCRSRPPAGPPQPPLGRGLGMATQRRA